MRELWCMRFFFSAPKVKNNIFFPFETVCSQEIDTCHFRRSKKFDKENSLQGALFPFYIGKLEKTGP